MAEPARARAAEVARPTATSSPPAPMPSYSGGPSLRLSGGEPLPTATRAPIERSFGADLGGVRVHTEPGAVRMADAMGASAFTVGTHIVLGSGQSPTNVPLMAHEATHVVQQSSAAGIQRWSLDSRNDPHEVEARSGANAVTAGQSFQVQGRVGSKPQASITGILAELATGNIATAAMMALDEYAPELAAVIRQGPLEWLEEKITSAIQTVIDTLTAPVRSITGFVGELRSLFGNLIEWIRDAAARIAKGDCGAIAEAAAKIQQVFEGLAAPVIDKIKNVAGKVKEFFTGLWDRFGAPVWDFLQRVAGRAWDKIKQFADWVWNKLAPIRNAVSRAWTWIKNRIGIGEGPEGQDGILQWVQRKATSIWDTKIKPFLERYKRPLMVVGGILLMLSPAGPFIAIGAMVYGLIQGVRWIRANLTTRDGVVRQREVFQKQIIPAIQSAIRSATTWLQDKTKFISDKLGGVVAGLGEAIGAVAGTVLNFLATALGWIMERFLELVNWATGLLNTLTTWVGQALAKLQVWLAPVLDFLRRVAAVVADTMKIAYEFGTRIWNAIPACLRDPFIDFFVPLILRQIPFFRELAATPEAWTKTREQIGTLVRQIFRDFDLIGAMKTAFNLAIRALNIPMELIQEVIQKAQLAWNAVIAAPMRFVLNALKAILLGVGRFMKGILGHLWFGVQGWLFNAMGDRSFAMPSGLGDWRGWLNLVLDILGLSVDHVIDLIDLRFPGKGRRLRQMVQMLTGALEWLQVALTQGPRGIWNKLMDKLKDVGNAVIEAAVGWVMERIIAIVSARLTALAASAGLSSVLEAVVAVYAAIKAAVEYANRILRVLVTVFDTVTQIAAGALDPAADLLVTGLRMAMPVVLGFLANYAMIGNVGRRISEIIGKVQKKVDDAILALIDGVRAAIQGVIDLIGRGIAAIRNWWEVRKTFTARDGQSHTLLFSGEGRSAILKIRSVEMPYSEFISRAQPGNDSAKIAAKAAAITIAGQIDTERNTEPAGATPEAVEAAKGQKGTRVNNLLEQLQPHTSILFGSTIPNSFTGNVNATPNAESFATSMSVKPLTNKNRPEGSPPTSAQNTRYAALNERRESPGGASYYIKGHLLNQQLGGPGGWPNLTPLSRSGNAQHERQVEAVVKRTVDLPAIVEYIVVPIYTARGDKTNLVNRINSSAEPQTTKQTKEAIVIAEDSVPTSLRIETYILDETLQRRNSIFNQTIPNPVDRVYDHYYLANTPRPAPVNLSTDDESKIGTVLPQAIADRLVAIRNARRSQGIATRWSSYQQLSDLVPGIGATRLRALQEAAHVSLY